MHGRFLPPIQPQDAGTAEGVAPAGPQPVSLVALQRQLLQSAQTHSSLRDLLNRGAALLSEYHAQLAIDQLRHTQHREDIQALSDEVQLRIAKTNERLQFLFRDSMRLEADNKKIEESIQKKDEEIAAQERQLALEESKLADATLGMQSLQSNVVALSKELIQAKNELLDANQQRQLARRRQWDVVADVAKLRESIAILKTEMRTLKKRLEAAHRAHPPRPLANDLRAVPATSTIAADPPSPSTSGNVHASAATAASVCVRPDCQYFLSRLEQLEEEDERLAARNRGGPSSTTTLTLDSTELSIPPPLMMIHNKNSKPQ